MATIDLTKPIIVSGASDDCIEIDGAASLEAYTYDNDYTPIVVNGITVASIAYDPDRSGNWRIAPGDPAPGVTVTITPAVGDDAEHTPVEPYLAPGTVRGYSDYAVITGDITSITVKDEHADL